MFNRGLNIIRWVEEEFWKDLHTPKRVQAVWRSAKAGGIRARGMIRDD